MAGKKAVFPIYEGSTLLDFGGATQVLAFAGFECVWCAATTEPVKTTEGVRVLPSQTFDSIAEDPIDVLFVPGGGDAVADVMLDPVYVGFLRAAAGRARWAGSVCTGAFPLAAAGQLDGYEATTYWSQRENLALFPEILVVHGYPRWVIQGDRFTGGGISSSIDLALELVNRMSGPEASMTAQLSVQYAPAPPFQAGDPSQAPPEITAEVLASQAGFIATIRAATEKVIGGG